MANIERTIVINAVSKGFGAIGSTLSELGAEINDVSQRLINFGKESIEVYKDYEHAMAEAEVALSTKYGRNTQKLAEVMRQLDESATNWAASTIFHTDDVANAIDQAAHAGWDLDMILNGIPVAMELAQAGSMDLSDALTYITKSMKAFDVPYDELGDFIDMWVYAANSSAGDVRDFGDAMLKMGSTMRFTDSKEELFALIGLMHDMGETGSTAATLLRTSMMRIIAPSGVATAVMEQLGATDEELQAIREDASKVAALATLESFGFSAFKDNGQAKPILDIYADLGAVLAEIAGGYENITKNKTTAGILGTIFGTRGITGALDIVNGLQSAVELRDKLLKGDATGYGEYAAGTVMDTLFGSTETFESKVERLKQVVGEELAPQVESIQGFVGTIVDNLSTMDKGNLSALVSGLEVIAAAGPGLLLAGGAFRLLGYVLTPAGGIGLGLTALTAAAAAIKELQDAKFAENFGNMQLDTSGIMDFVTGLGEDFGTAYEKVNNFAEALNTSVENYTKASQTFSSTLFQDMLTGVQLGEPELKVLTDLGQDMFAAVQGAISSSMAKSGAYWQQLFGGEGVAEYDPAYQEIVLATNEAYESAMEEAKGIGEGLKNAVMEAWNDDGIVDGEEYQNILSWFKKYEAAIAKAAAEAANEERQIEFQKDLRRARSASLEDIRKMSDKAAEDRDALLEQREEMWLDESVRAEMAGASEASMNEARRLYEEDKAKVEAQYDEFLMTLWGSQIQQSGQEDNYAFLAGVAQQYMNGEIGSDAAMDMIRKTLGDNKYAGQEHWDMGWNTTSSETLGKLMGYWLNSMGGEESVQSRIAWYDENGNTGAADALRQMYAMEQLVNGFQTIERVGKDGDFWNWLLGDFVTSGQDEYASQAPNRTAAEETIFGSQELVDAYQELRDLKKQKASIESEIATQEGWLRGENRPLLWLEGATKDALYGHTDNYGRKSEGLYDQRAQIDADIEKAQEKIDALKETAEEETEMPLEVDTEDAETAIQTLDENIEQERIMPVTTDLDSSAVDEYQPEDKYATVHYNVVTEGGAGGTGGSSGSSGGGLWGSIKRAFGFAEGGRADEASIFAEEGAEWAIPEEHSQRTAELLNAAREASGFTWPDLLARFGGMNANPNNAPTTLVYSPTINAQDARGVEQVLAEDKKRLDKWYSEKKMHDEMEVYA